MRRRTRRALGSVLAAVIATALAGTAWATFDLPTPPAIELPTGDHASAQAPAGDPTDYATLAETAATLELIDPAAQIPEYSRDSFGGPWTDIEGSGCRQRDDVLARDLHDVVRDQCTVLSGTLDPDPYTGARIEFEHDRIASPGEPGSQGVQIEHIVSLSAAHKGGAWAWTDQQRLTFANELDHLIAVDGPANAAKNDQGPGTWMPANDAYVCPFAARYTQIVIAWDIAVTEPDRAALEDTLQECGSGE